MNTKPLSLRTEIRDTLILAGPIVLSQAGHMSMGLVDTLVAGRISTTALAGLGLAANFFWTFTAVCGGLLLALDTYFSQSVGAKDKAALARYLGQSIWTCAIVTVLSAVCILAAWAVYMAVASASPTRDVVVLYLKIIIWSLPSIFVFFLLQRYWQARHCVVPFTVMIIGANILNLAACFALGLGMWDFPRLEVQGIAMATLFSRYVMLLAALIFTWQRLRPQRWIPPAPDKAVQRQFFKLGVPASGHAGLEVGAFTIATFVVSALGAVPLAAHHVTLTMASFTFMFPLGFSAAAAVRVGMYIGARQPERARLAGWLCISISAAVMSTFALVYLLFPQNLLGWFSADPAVIELGVKLLMLVALFQIADGLQVSATGALRGLGNTRAAMLANLIGHYPVGLALGLVLCFGFGYGVVGIWAGLAAGLIAVAILLLRVWAAITRDLSELQPLAAQDPSQQHHSTSG